MSKVQQLRDKLRLRLTADDKEIFELFEGVVSEYEGVIADYEEEICSLKEENKGWKELATVFNPQVCLYRADPQQLLVNKDDVIPEHQEHTMNLVQNDSRPTNIKVEQKELWVSQEGKQLHGLREADITKFPFTVVSVKSENEDEKPQSSQVHQSQRDESTEAEPVASSSTAHRTLTTQVDCKGYGERQPASNSGPDSPLQPNTSGSSLDSSETDSYKWKQIKKCSSGFNCLKNSKVSVGHNGSKKLRKQLNCCEYRKDCCHKNYLKRQKGRQHSEKPFWCSECGKRFGNKWNLNRHIKIHTGQKPFRCSVCGKRFVENCDLNKHMKIHSGQKPFGCSECGKRFGLKSYLSKHVIIHTGQKPFNCSECGKGFGQKISLIRHMMIHTGHLALLKSQIFG
ncbi:zinc finger protein 350-like [Thalassophryne amazonica]|uniref:zinc finger protein 350-like n=1 Tax=Thalassophryne amazonica TaxID=390379 RepID=UPI0014711F05|nr:zinc finger protein 350-like [Thalassophryne amazonica]